MILWFPVLLLALVGSPVAAQDRNCAERLDAVAETLADGPLLKEELATGLMWMRLDAAEAESRGDEEACLALAERIEMLIRNNFRG
jgi:hypothetical protein